MNLKTLIFSVIMLKTQKETKLSEIPWDPFALIMLFQCSSLTNTNSNISSILFDRMPKLESFFLQLENMKEKYLPNPGFSSFSVDVD